MRKTVYSLLIGLCLVVPAHALSLQDAVDIRYASEVCRLPLTATAKGLLKKLYRGNPAEFERLYAQYDGANVSESYCSRVQKGFGKDIFGKRHDASVSTPIPAADGVAPAGSLQGYANRCRLKLTDKAVSYISIARKANLDGFNSAKLAAGQDPSPCEVVVGYFVKGGELYDNFGFKVIETPEPE
ncbi:hypothetical protein P9272_31975 [Mesorhizobium sp. WSM4976]|uniref:hypothetical protein n=1 Tax=Mesorhizobium sp. WSM4976 TaxID=3038549 RepID=UPI0024162224|nr:hypothetical protein [Mesorhizobium sp. WSM4976]MDG4898160.1 hypothetical protein [Mesorhizobium sp. WSM4976]